MSTRRHFVRAAGSLTLAAVGEAQATDDHTLLLSDMSSLAISPPVTSLSESRRWLPPH